MPNILLTQKCVRSCPYCFAKKQMNEGDAGEVLKWEDLVYLADLFAQGNCMEMRFLGGEPTLHPHFADFLAYSLKRGFSVTVFSSGIVSEKVKEDIRRVYKAVPGAAKDVAFLCNLNDPELSPAAETRRVEEFLEEFGAAVMPGFNIYRKDFSLDFLFRYINRYGLKRSVRLGLTHPILRENNSFIGIGDMKGITDRLLGYLPHFIQQDVVPSLDCGFPMCLFSDEQLGLLHKAARGAQKFTCGSPVDIGPDMTAWACFPLSAARRKSVYEFDSYGEMTEYFSSFAADIRKEAGGIFAECDACRWRKSGLCGGGCAAHMLKEIDKEGGVRPFKI
ncbi:MAG: radical SAM protein [Elusimicrobiales bacterium]